MIRQHPGHSILETQQKTLDALIRPTHVSHNTEKNTHTHFTDD